MSDLKQRLDQFPSEVILADTGTTDLIFLELADAGELFESVETLSLANCKVTDACIEPIARLFPGLKALYAQNTQIAGANIDRLFQGAPDLHYLALDGAAVTAACTDPLLDALSKRAEKKGIAKTTVLLRNIGRLDARWSKVLDFASNSRTASRFEVLTDLQKPFGQRPRHALQVHDSVDVYLYMHRLPVIKVVHSNVPACKLVMHIARDAVGEVNLVALGDVRTVSDVTVMRRRLQYRTALEQVFNDGYFFNKTFKRGDVQVTVQDVLTGTRTAHCAGEGQMIGPVKPTEHLVIQVELVSVPMQYTF